MIWETVSVNGPGNMAAPVGHEVPQPSTLPDLHRRPSRSSYSDLQDPVVTEAASSSSDPASTAVWYVTIAWAYCQCVVFLLNSVFLLSV